MPLGIPEENMGIMRQQQSETQKEERKMKVRNEETTKQILYEMALLILTWDRS